MHSELYHKVRHIQNTIAGIIDQGVIFILSLLYLPTHSQKILDCAERYTERQIRKMEEQKLKDEWEKIRYDEENAKLAEMIREREEYEDKEDIHNPGAGKARRGNQRNPACETDMERKE